MFHEFLLCLGGTLSLKINDNYSCGVKIQVAPNQETHPSPSNVHTSELGFFGKHWKTNYYSIIISNWQRKTYWKKCPLVICYIAIENGPVEIVDLPNLKMVIFHSYVNVY